MSTSDDQTTPTPTGERSVPERKAMLLRVEKSPEGSTTKRTRFVASTAAPDRDGDTIDPAGWQLENYRKNPVFLWAHNYSRLPLGRADAQIEGTQLVIDVEWDTADPFAAEVQRKYAEGFLNAVSVGFAPIKAIPRGGDSFGLHFLEQDLLEVSAVPVPSNPQALAMRSAPAWEAVRKGFDERAEAWLVERGYEVRSPDALAPPPVEAPDDAPELPTTPDQISDAERERLAALVAVLGYDLVPRTAHDHPPVDVEPEEAAAAVDDTPALDDVQAPSPDDGDDTADPQPQDNPDDPVVLLLVDDTTLAPGV